MSSLTAPSHADSHDPGPAAGTPTLGPGPVRAPRRSPALERVGPYRILRPLGEGGMGTVYLAEQVEPFERQVALKLIRPGSTMRGAARRLEAERQALALMSHPNIAQIYDAGATDTGQPYFVMEHIDGLPVTRYADRHRLDVRRRLALFRTICDGVQHAHQKGILHRDIKPTNVLVADHTCGPVAKIIDFGIAKALDCSLTDSTLLTGEGLLGTPSYMSPERLESPADIDTRSDIYSLGVLLYELLTGALPFESERKSFVRLVKRILNEPVPAPSTRLQTLSTQRQEAIARRRGTEPPSLRRRLAGDLEWIVMKAIHRDPTRRYQSAAELNADLERYLRQRPVLAGSPSGLYRLRKLIRRHRVGVAAAAVTFLALLAGAGAATVGLIRARAAQQQAEQAEVRERAAHDFLRDMLASAAPAADSREVKVIEVLAESAERLETAFAGQPEVRAELLHTLGATYLDLGQTREAQPLLAEALALRRKLFGPQHPETLESLHSHIEWVFQEGDDARAERLARQLVELQRRHGAARRETLQAIDLLIHVLLRSGTFDEAKELGLVHLAVARRSLGGDDPLTLSLLNRLSWALAGRGDLELAEELGREAVDRLIQVVGEDHPDTLEAMENLAVTLQYRDRSAEATALLRRVLEASRRVYGEEHPKTLGVIGNLAGFLTQQGAHAEAEEVGRELLEVQGRVLGTEHPDTLLTAAALASSVLKQGRHGEARQLAETVLATHLQVLGEEHTYTLYTRYLLGRTLSEQGEPAAAEAELRQALEGQRQAYGGGHPAALRSLYSLAEAVAAQGRFEESEALHREALAERRRTLGDDHRDVGTSARALIALYETWGRPEAAAEVRAMLPGLEAPAQAR